MFIEEIFDRTSIAAHGLLHIQSKHKQVEAPTVPSAVIWGSNEDLWCHKCVIVSHCVKKSKNKLSKSCQKLSKRCQKVVKKLQKVAKSCQKSCQKVVKKLSKSVKKYQWSF
jgi:hypothetical protein